MKDKTVSRRWAQASGVGVGVLALGLLLWWLYQPRALLVEVAAVAVGRFERVIEEDGQLRLRNRYVVTAPTQAVLQRPTLRVGDRVRAGDVVAVLQPVSPQLMDDRTRDVLSQRVGAASAARRAAGAQVQRLQTVLAQAQLDAQRATQLAGENFVSAAARDQARLAYQAARQSLDAGQAELAAADFVLAEARAALGLGVHEASAGQAALWTIKSPLDGQVLKLYLDNAAPVQMGQPLLELGDLSALEAVIDVLSGEVGAIQPGAAVSLTTGGKAASWKGRVERVEPTAFTKASALGIDEQRVNVIVNFSMTQDHTRRLGDGFKVDASIILQAHDGVLLAPSAALVRDGTGWQVFVVEDGRARARSVAVEDRNAEVAWLHGGLKPGDKVVLYPGSMVGDGQHVKPRP